MAGGIVYVAVDEVRGVGRRGHGDGRRQEPTTPLAVYGHQVYPELPAAQQVLAAVAALVPPAPC